MAHDSAVAVAASPFESSAEAIAPPGSTAVTEPQRFEGSGPGGEEPFVGLFDHGDVKSTGKGGGSGVEASRGKGAWKGKAGVGQTTKGTSLSVGGSHTSGKRTRSLAVGRDPDGTTVGFEDARERPSGKTGTASLGVNATKGELTGGYKLGSGEGAKARSTELSATLGKDTIGAKAKVSRGDHSLSAGAERRSTYGKPTRLPDGRWAVTYDTSVSASLGGGTKKISAGVDGAHGRGGTRVFQSQEQADAFARGEHAALSDDPLALGVGETLTRSDGGKIKLSGEAAVGPGAIGGGISGGATRAETITRVDERFVDVLVSRGHDVGASASGGAGLAGVGFGAEGGLTEDRRYRFDVTTEDGRRALARYRETGVAPAKYLFAVGHGETSGTSRTANLGVVGVGTSGKSGERFDVDTDGNAGYTATGVRTKSASLLGVGEHTATAQLVSGPLGTDLTAMVKSSEGGSSMAEIAEATGTRSQPMKGQGAVASSGTWSVESHLTDEEVQEFARRVAGNGKVVLAPLGSLDGHGAELQARIRQSKGMRDLRRAMADFVAAAGGKGAAWIRQIAGVTDYDVKLENDANFTGAAGRAELEAEIAHHRELVESGHGDAKAIAAEVARLEERCRAIGDLQKYTDLPAEVRVHEVKRVIASIVELRQLERLATPSK